MPTSGSKGMPRETTPNTVPSRGAALYSQLASFQAARPIHILRNDGGIARNELSEVPCGETSVDIVAAANRETDVNLHDVGPAIEIRDRILRMRRRFKRYKGRQSNQK